MSSPCLSICIVNWNTREYLRACLQSIHETLGDITHEVIVVDNASTDGSVEMVRQEFPEISLIANRTNRLYAAGNNQALERAQGAYLLLLNPDVVLQEGAIVELIACMERHPKAGAVAPKLVYPDGAPQLSCRSFPDPAVIWYEALGLSHLFPHSRRFGKYRMSWWTYDEERTVDQPMASALLLRSEALEKIGHFDVEFPLFFNDVDLCRRLWDAGWEVWFTPRARVVHHVGGSTRQIRPAMVRESHRSLLRYYEKHYRGRLHPGLYYVTYALIRAGGTLRGFAAQAQWGIRRLGQRLHPPTT
ncbi:MAG: glycosyltransferase family 2 protein [Candidatus Zipacnadales bacterium]